MKTINILLLLGLTGILGGKLLMPITQKITANNPGSTGTVHGKVTDAADGSIIPFANINLVSSDQKNAYHATSDFQGEFIINQVAVGKYTMKTTMVGYEPKIAQILVTEGVITRNNAALDATSIEIREEVVSYDVPTQSIQLEFTAKQSRLCKTEANYMPQGGAYALADAAYNTESYDAISENDFKSVSSSPLSTFSIDVDAASYSNLRRFIMNGQTPPRDAIRVEEMINYFSYDYPNPEGEHPFSIITEAGICPWNPEHQLIHIGLQGKRLQMENLPPNNLVFLIDASGSMQSPNKMPLLKQSLNLLVEQLRPQDRVSIVVYAGAAGLVLESTSGKNKERISEAINRLEAGGSTAGGAGIALAYKEAISNLIKGGNNRVILATDGDFNVGASSDAEMVELIEKKRESGVFLTVLGFGMGNYKDSKMEKLADKGNGNYAYIDNLLEAKKVLVNEVGATMFTIAKDVKLQVEFNPALVASYKLVGYENRLLNDEDFNDDTKDAGELGAGHSVTALYEIVPAGGNSRSVDPLKYQTPRQQSMNHDQELLTVKFRYKEPGGTSSKLITNVLKPGQQQLSECSNDFRFSAAVASFGMLARDSKHKGNTTIHTVLNLARGSKGNDAEGYRAEFIRLVEMYELQAQSR